MLRNVSRSFYLTLRILPDGLRAPIGLAYLLARAADTIADTALIPAEHRVELLLALRAQINGEGDAAGLSRIKAEAAKQSDSHEAQLLGSLDALLAQWNAMRPADKSAVRDVVTTLTTGMEFDLRTFPDERSGRIAALETGADLDRYTYLVAGCVGEFWTRMICSHRPELAGWNVDDMSRSGVRFGKALQLTNILRDCPKDLRIGRCYLPGESLVPLGLRPEELLSPQSARAARPVVTGLLRQALDHFRHAERYLLAIPRTSLRLRLACLWPVLIGLETLALLARHDGWLDPERPVKVTRRKVYRIIAMSLPIAGSNALLSRWIQGIISDVEAQLNRT